MPPRLPTFSTLRQGLASVKTPVAPLSTKAPLQQGFNKPSSALLGMDSNNRSRNNNNQTPADPTSMVADIFASMPGRKDRAESRRQLEKDLGQIHLQDEHARLLNRRWETGDVYAPYDLGAVEMKKWGRTYPTQYDIIKVLGIQPLDLYRNFTVISEFITPHGRIQRRADTGLSPVNQRKVAKAIRRSIGLGLHPSVHVHPEILMKRNFRVQMKKLATSAPISRTNGL